MTNDGPLIVHNCVLGLGYGTGAEKLQHTFKTQPPYMDISLPQCKEIVSIYRSVNYKIPEFWNECDTALDAMLAGREYGWLGAHKGVVWAGRNGLRMPGGIWIRYDGLRVQDGKKVYTSRKGTVNIWGGYIVENLTQNLARNIVCQQLVWVQQELGHRAALTVHDSGVWVIKEDEAEQVQAEIERIMSRTLPWAAGLPVACEAKYAASYGAC